MPRRFCSLLERTVCVPGFRNSQRATETDGYHGRRRHCSSQAFRTARNRAHAIQDASVVAFGTKFVLPFDLWTRASPRPRAPVGRFTQNAYAELATGADVSSS